MTSPLNEAKAAAKRRAAAQLLSRPVSRIGCEERKPASTFSILNPSGKGLSEEVEKMLRDRLLNGNTEATRGIYENAGMTQDENGVWTYPGPMPTSSKTSVQTPLEPSETPVEQPKGVTQGSASRNARMDALRRLGIV